MTAIPTLSPYLTFMRVSEDSLVSYSPDSGGSTQTCFKNAALRNPDAKDHKTPQSTSLHLRNRPETRVKHFASILGKTKGTASEYPQCFMERAEEALSPCVLFDTGPAQDWKGLGLVRASVYKWLTSVCRNQQVQLPPGCLLPEIAHPWTPWRLADSSLNTEHNIHTEVPDCCSSRCRMTWAQLFCTCVCPSFSPSLPQPAPRPTPGRVC